MARDKLAIDPLALVGICLTLVGMAAGGTWFLISRFENSENVLLKEQVKYLEQQVQTHKQESEEKSDVLRRIRSSQQATPEIRNLLETVIKESSGILGARELGINEAVTIPNTDIRIVYEDVIRYPLLDRLKKLLPISSKWVVSPSSLQVRVGDSLIVSNYFPRAGTEIQFEQKCVKYRLVILAVRETSIRISLFATAGTSKP